MRNEYRRAAGASTPPAESLDCIDLPDEREELFGLEVRDALRENVRTALGQAKSSGND